MGLVKEKGKIQLEEFSYTKDEQEAKIPESFSESVQIWMSSFS